MRKARFKKRPNLNQNSDRAWEDAVILLPIQEGIHNPAILV
jgi:hypothetical protein